MSWFKQEKGSWMDVKGKKGDWTKARTHEEVFGCGWWTPGSEPMKTLLQQKKVTPESFFTDLGDGFLGLK